MTKEIDSQQKAEPEIEPPYIADKVDGMHVGESPIPGITLRHILRGHKDVIGRISWSPDGLRLASPSRDQTIRVWDIESGKCLAILQGHNSWVNSVSWSIKYNLLASGSDDKTIRFWNTKTWKNLNMQFKHDDRVNSVSWSPDGQRLASGSNDNTIRIWNIKSKKHPVLLRGHANSVTCVSWSSDGQRLASGSFDNTIRIWNTLTGITERRLINHSNEIHSVAWAPNQSLLASCARGDKILIWNGQFDPIDEIVTLWEGEPDKPIKVIDGPASSIECLSFSSDGIMFASKCSDNAIRFFRTDTWSTVAVLKEVASSYWPPGIAFHPCLPCIATLGENDTVIRIWDLDMDLLLRDQTAAEWMPYTTAKLVLLGNSGVGKTSLGWRLAHDEFKRHRPTHGQHFWVIDNLSRTRADGTKCEAVLWDLASQEIYNHANAILLDNVDLSLVLFDTATQQESLKGAEFWLEQLACNNKLPPSVLVGARIDRGTPVLSQPELDQFCQRHGITGGYISTSAMTGVGLEKLLGILKTQIPWEQNTAMVTSFTFKRIKEYVLALKEKPDRRVVLVNPDEMRKKLEVNNPGWQFSSDDMMNAVKHLENHGYLAILRRPLQEQVILLIPELLVKLASSILLKASNHPLGLGELSKTTMLQSGYDFPELMDLEQDEQSILLDAVVMRLLEHNICFTESAGNETLLIFPDLIKKEHALPGVEIVEDYSYTVHGQTKRIYATLVVFLGNSQVFTRISHWHNQAQYETSQGEICGFQMKVAKEGEVELVLYSGLTTSSQVRREFQDLFKSILIEYCTMLVPQIVSSNYHHQGRPSLSKGPSGGKKLSCKKSGALSAFDLAGGADDRLCLAGDTTSEPALQDLSDNLKRSDLRVDVAAPDKAYVDHAFTIAISIKQPYSPILSIDDLKNKTSGNVMVLYPKSQKYIPLQVEITANDCEIHGEKRINFCLPVDEDSGICYFSLTPKKQGEISIIITIYQGHTWRGAARVNTFARKRIAGKSKLKIEVFNVDYVDFKLHIEKDGHIKAESEDEGEAKATISTQIPDFIQETVNAIENNQIDEEKLKQFGDLLYDWIFPSEIKINFERTEAGADKKGAMVRLRLKIDEESIAHLPLEFIHLHTGNYFLATNPKRVLSRYLEFESPKKQVCSHKPPFHMLAIIADPNDKPRLNPDDWEVLIKSALEQPLGSGKMTLQTVKRATRNEISKALLNHKPDIVQFIGHGSYLNGKGYLDLVDEETDGTWRCDDESFADVFMGFDPGLISLATCESARTDDAQGFLGIAPQLVQRGIPAVVAMQYKVKVKTAKTFLTAFYQALASGKPVDWATQDARKQIKIAYGSNNREFGTPVLYMRAKDGHVFYSQKSKD